MPEDWRKTRAGKRDPEDWDESMVCLLSGTMRGRSKERTWFGSKDLGSRISCEQR
jgi:hypothetical protein